MTERTQILDTLFLKAEHHMATLVTKQGYFTNLEILRLITQEQQVAYIDLLYSFRDTENRSPFNAAHQEIGRRILRMAEQAGYERAKELDREGQDIFGNSTSEIIYRPRQS